MHDKVGWKRLKICCFFFTFANFGACISKTDKTYQFCVHIWSQINQFHSSCENIFCCHNQRNQPKFGLYIGGNLQLCETIIQAKTEEENSGRRPIHKKIPVYQKLFTTRFRHCVIINLFLRRYSIEF